MLKTIIVMLYLITTNGEKSSRRECQNDLQCRFDEKCIGEVKCYEPECTFESGKGFCKRIKKKPKKINK